LFQRILTNLERKRIRAYLKTSGKKRTAPIKTLISRAHKNLPEIDRDRQLLIRLEETYQQRDQGIIWEKGEKYPGMKGAGRLGYHLDRRRSH